MDYLFVGAHPDDCELSAGGLIAKAISLGRKSAILDLTCGEMGTRGSVEERKSESESSANLLGVSTRITLNLGDTLIENTLENRLEIIKVLRKLRPRTIVFPYEKDSHPDHRKASVITHDAIYYSKLSKIKTEDEKFSPEFSFQYFLHHNALPTIVVDITDHFEKKMASIKCYKSQFYNPDYKGEATKISSKEFLETIEIRSRYYGSMIGVKYGEPFYCKSPLAINDPINLIKGKI